MMLDRRKEQKSAWKKRTSKVLEAGINA